MQGVYQNIEEYILRKIRKVLIVFDDMIAGINKKLNLVVTELFSISIKHFYCFYYTIIF